MKGLILAGGTGSRLWPSTISTSKQLLPIYDKPMIYYPLATLMLAKIREYLIITTLQDKMMFERLLGDGHKFGISIKYATQPTPEGLAQAYLIAEEFLGQDNSMLILGDNIFHGVGLGNELNHKFDDHGAHIFTYEVSNPGDYGILELNDEGTPVAIIEKPRMPKSNLAVTGLYFFDNRASRFARLVKPSDRGELEITALIEFYLNDESLEVTHLSRGTAWLDTGNPNAMHDAASYVRVIEERTGLKIGCPEEIAFRNGWISKEDLQLIISDLGSSAYGKYLQTLLAK